MSKRLWAVVFVVLVASCSGGNNSAPRNLDNACSIVNQRPSYLRAMKRTERKWGVPVHVQMAVIHQESKFIANARTPVKYTLGVIPMGRQSSAYGYAQALDGTWDDYRDATGRRGARRNNIGDATDFMGWYFNNASNRLGLSKSDARNQYLAYHDGITGYSRGSYRSKGWLVNVAARVQSRANMYRSQLTKCS